LWIFPELGILGAGIATVVSWSIVALIFLFMVFTRENDRVFKVRRNRRFDAELFGRLMKFGIPGALQFSMDIFAFTFFIFMVGRIGKNELAVTNIVFTIENLSFMPLMGFALGTSTLVGQALGRNRPDEAVSATRATIHIVSAYTFLLVLAFVFVPRPLLDLFRPDSLSAESYVSIQSVGIVLLRFVAGYLFFDSLYMICTGVLKGAGDTRFIMWSIGLLSVIVMILPIYIGIAFLGAGLFYAWIWLTLYVFLLFAVSLARYFQGKWKQMRVIEKRAIDSES
jgi:MATE family multidrug resistance protein